MSTEKIRKLSNKVTLRGKLAELETLEGTTKETNENYIRVRGAIQFGDHAVCTKRFEMFAKETNKDGSQSKVYNNLQSFVDSAIPMTLNKEDPTLVALRGELAPNDYINREDELVESVIIRGSFLDSNYNDSDYNEEDYPATYIVEGYVQSLVDEVKDDELTGRKRMTLLTTNFMNEAVILKNLIIPKEKVEDFEDAGYEQGVTAMFRVELMPHIEEVKPSKGGFGKKVFTSGTSYLEMIVVGGDKPLDEDNPNAINSKTVKALIKERNIKLDNLKENGYQGNNGADNSKKSTAKSKTASKKTVETPDLDEDDLPF